MPQEINPYEDGGELEDEPETIGEVVLQVIGFLLIAGGVLGAFYFIAVLHRPWAWTVVKGLVTILFGAGIINYAFVRRGRRTGHE